MANVLILGGGFGGVVAALPDGAKGYQASGDDSRLRSD